MTRRPTPARTVPRTGPRTGPRTATGGDLLHLVRVGGVDTRAELCRATGLSRPAVAARVAALVDAGLLTERTDGPSTGGRPPARLAFNAAGGVVLVANLGHSRGQLAVCDLAGRVLTQRDAGLPPAAAPADALPRLLDGWTELMASADIGAPVRGVGLGVPDAVPAGRWDGLDPSPAVAARFGVPAHLDNEVNAAALGEHHAGAARDADDVLFVKLSTGIGAGLIMGGRVQRGAFGAAGEIGHVAVPGGGDAPCRCGASGCLEAVAGGAALLAGSPAADLAELSALARAGDPATVALVRAAGHRIGAVLAGAVNLLNPALVVLGGDLTGAYEPLVAGVRAEVYGRATAPATSRLRIEPSALGDAAGVIGCAAMVLDRILAPTAVDTALA